ncbi:hypothetical protein [Streptomyces sp. NPDC059631]|uniref:hypothetical protein n=1 Tax=unclassified Streptomyces TaxID=2593676 RepID=UPI0036D143D9
MAWIICPNRIAKRHHKLAGPDLVPRWPGLHTALGEWERLISRNEAADAATAARTAEMHGCELHDLGEQFSASASGRSSRRPSPWPATDDSALRTTRTQGSAR